MKTHFRLSLSFSAFLLNELLNEKSCSMPFLLVKVTKREKHAMQDTALNGLPFSPL